jgi:hypothetical protein
MMAENTRPSANSEIRCIRRACIEDPEDLYHHESHTCFVCGAEFDPSPEMMGQICEVCNWYKCPTCGGCQCSLSPSDQAWMEAVRNTYCQDVGLMANLRLEDLPATDNPHVKEGLGMQLRFCRRWAVEQMRAKPVQK